ncbi:MAG: M15 family metallopeptidase [Bosea sp. (in: a-proteobacteria)]
MSATDQRQTDYAQLHPVMRERVRGLLQQINAEGHPFALFEAFRTPDRQRFLYEVGRTREMGRGIITKARAWQSFHQYGLAVDLVLRPKGQWSWDDSGENQQAWVRLHVLGRAAGLRPLSFEKPHLEWAGSTLASLQAGRYPEGGDDSWASNLSASIISWRRGRADKAAPPLPRAALLRPRLPSSAQASARA